MLLTLWRLTRGYRLRPWSSPYLRWRIETYWGLHADRITFSQFWAFAWRQKRELARYLHWADGMRRATRTSAHLREVHPHSEPRT